MKKPRPHGEAIHKCSSPEPWLKSQFAAIIDLCMNKISDDSSPQPLSFPDFMDSFSLRTHISKDNLSFLQNLVCRSILPPDSSCLTARFLDTGVLYLKMIFGMAVTSGEVTTSCIILVMVFVFVRELGNKGRKEVFPPGPWSLPIVENLLQLGDHLYLTFMEMRKKYGDVFLIKLGMVPVLVVNGMEMVKEVLLRNGEHFAA